MATNKHNSALQGINKFYKSSKTLTEFLKTFFFNYVYFQIEDNSIIAIIPKKAINSTLQKNYSKNNLNNSGLKHHDSTTRLLTNNKSFKNN